MAESFSVETTDALERTRERARAWQEAGDGSRGAGDKLRDILASDGGRDFAVGAIDSILRPASLSAAAAHWRRSAHSVPVDLAWPVRSAVRAGAKVAPLLPSPVVPLARTALRSLLGALTLDPASKRWDAAVTALAEHGSVELVVPATHATGVAAATRYQEHVRELVQRPGVSRVVVRVSSLIPSLSLWNFDAAVIAAVSALEPLVIDAAAADTTLVLQVSVTDEQDLAVAVLASLMENPPHSGMRLGVSLPAALVESASTLDALLALTAESDDASSLLIQMRDGWADPANASDSIRHGWADDALTRRDDVRLAMIRAIDAVTRANAAESVALSVVTGDLDIAAYALSATELANIDSDVTVLKGAEPAWFAALQSDSARGCISALAVSPGDVALASDALEERIRQTAAVLEPSELTDDSLREQVFADLVERARTEDRPRSRRVQDRSRAVAEPAAGAIFEPGAGESADLTEAVLGIARSARATHTSPIAPDAENLLFGGAPFVETAVFSDLESGGTAYGAPGFVNEAATDPSRAANRAWALSLGDGDDSPELAPESPAAAVAAIRQGDGEWEHLSAAERALVLERVGFEIAQRRGELIVASRAAGVVFADADRDVTTAVDLAHYYAATVRELDTISGAVFVPSGVTLVAADPADLVASLAESTLSCLAVGGSVVLAAPARWERAYRVLAQALWAAGVPDTALHVARTTLREGARQAGADRVMVAASQADVADLLEQHPGPVTARVRGVNTAIVTVSADPEESARDIVYGAFARAGQAFDSTTMAILAGAVARSDRFARALVDAATSLEVDEAHNLGARVGELAADLSDDELWALTELEPGQSWLVKPRQLGERLWAPGIRTGVERDSRFAGMRYAVPVLGIMAAPSLSAAIDAANAVGDGGVATLATSDPTDVALWLQGMNAGSLFIGRPAPHAVVQRQPEGGWNGAIAGIAAKAGGPNRLVSMGAWRSVGGRAASGTLHLRGLDSRITTIIEAAQPDLDFDGFDWVRRAALSDALVWDREFAHVKDVSRLGVERNLFRYRPARIAVRATAETPLSTIVRLVLAGIRTKAEFTMSVASGLPSSVRRALGDADVALFVETDEEFTERATASRVPRVRIVGPGAADAAAELRARAVSPIGVFADQATTAGRIELLAFLREQSVTLAGRTAQNLGDII